jgi:hypothetical protein
MKICLLVMDGIHAGQRIDVQGMYLMVGRSAACHVRPNSPEVSERHCALVEREDSFFLRDLESKAGTFLNDRRLRGEIELRDGDLIRVGPLLFLAQISAQEKAAALPTNSVRTVHAVPANGPLIPSPAIPELAVEAPTPVEVEARALPAVPAEEAPQEPVADLVPQEEIEVVEPTPPVVEPVPVPPARPNRLARQTMTDMVLPEIDGAQVEIAPTTEPDSAETTEPIPLATSDMVVAEEVMEPNAEVTTVRLPPPADESAPTDPFRGERRSRKTMHGTTRRLALEDEQTKDEPPTGEALRSMDNHRPASAATRRLMRPTHQTMNGTVPRPTIGRPAVEDPKSVPRPAVRPAHQTMNGTLRQPPSEHATVDLSALSPAANATAPPLRPQRVARNTMLGTAPRLSTESAESETGGASADSKPSATANLPVPIVRPQRLARKTMQGTMHRSALEDEESASTGKSYFRLTELDAAGNPLPAALKKKRPPAPSDDAGVTQADGSSAQTTTDMNATRVDGEPVQNQSRSRVLAVLKAARERANEMDAAKKLPAPLVGLEAPVSVLKQQHLKISCPNCGCSGRLPWGRLNNLLCCAGCWHWFRVGRGGSLVGVSAPTKFENGALRFYQSDGEPRVEPITANELMHHARRRAKRKYLNFSFSLAVNPTKQSMALCFLFVYLFGIFAYCWVQFSGPAQDHRHRAPPPVLSRD